MERTADAAAIDTDDGPAPVGDEGREDGEGERVVGEVGGDGGGNVLGLGVVERVEGAVEAERGLVDLREAVVVLAAAVAGAELGGVGEGDALAAVGVAALSADVRLVDHHAADGAEGAGEVPGEVGANLKGRSRSIALLIECEAEDAADGEEAGVEGLDSGAEVEGGRGGVEDGGGVGANGEKQGGGDDARANGLEGVRIEGKGDR